MERIPELRERALSIKRRFLAMYKSANAGHIGSSLSCAEMLTAVRLAWMGPRDRLVLSKGHAAAALYATLCEAGDIAPEDIATFYKDGTRLAAHPPPALTTNVPFATGSLGHGLSLAAGLALGARLRGRDETVYCISSDGELNEGGIWEAAMFAAQHRLRNLVWLIDRNGIQGFGRTEDVMALEPLQAKLAAFGLGVAEADGHDFDSLLAARRATEGHAGPTVLLCRTVKGNGLSFMADTIDSHYLPMTDAQYAQALAELDEVRLAG